LERKRLTKQFLAVIERQVRRVIAVKEQQVENVMVNGDAAFAR
jgi:hypothetical protein